MELAENPKAGPRQNAQADVEQQYFSFAELAKRWRCSRGTVYNRLRRVGAEVLDFAQVGKRGKKVIALETIVRIEESKTKRLR